MERKKAVRVLRTIGESAGDLPKSLAVCAAAATGDPFRVLVTTLLSLRNRDEATGPASERVLSRWPRAADLARADEEALGEAVRPSSLWRTKVRALREVSQAIVTLGRVPRTVDELVKIKWIGRKTANLVATLAYGEEGLCVDTHVFRVGKRIGLHDAKNVKTAEQDLKKLLPKRLWRPLNDILVYFGRTQCTPVSPKCSTCPISEKCSRNGVSSSR